MDHPGLEKQFQDFFEKNTSVMLLINPEQGKILDANPSAVNFYGFERNQLIGMPISQLNQLSQDRILEEMKLAVLEKRNYFRFQHRLSNGEIRNVEVHSTPLISNQATLLFSIIHDVTDRTLAEAKVATLLDEKEILLREVHHRIKNNMSMIYSLLELQIDSIKHPSAISALTDAASRVQSMAMLYDKLYLTQDYDQVSVSQYMNSLTTEIISNFPNRDLISLELDIFDADLEVKRLQYLGIIVNEILTNIMKYAFEKQQEGNISIIGRIENTDYFLRIKDNGKGMPESIDFENPNGFGLSLIQFLSKRLQASLSIERKNGTVIHIRLPIKIS